jgi:hypothetical protein
MHDDYKIDNDEFHEIIKKQNAEEAAHYVQNGYSREEAVSKVKELNIQRDDPDNCVETDDDVIEFLDSSLNYPKINKNAQNKAIAEELEDEFD